MKKKIFDNLCDLYPATAENLRQRALERRMHFIKVMEEQDRKMIDNKHKALRHSITRRPESKLRTDGSQMSLNKYKMLAMEN